MRSKSLMNAKPVILILGFQRLQERNNVLQRGVVYDVLQQWLAVIEVANLQEVARVSVTVASQMRTA